MAVDSSGIKMTNRGEWIVRKWKQRRKGSSRYTGVDVKTKQILAVKVTDEHSFQTSQESARFGMVSKVLVDGTYDSREIFPYVDRTAT
jgi:hypothetical protein